MADLYATETRMQRMFGVRPLVALTGGPPNSDDPADIDADVLEQARQDAQDELDGYLATQVTLPIPSGDVPRAVRLHACNVAYYYLDVDNPTEGALARYKNAIAWAKRVASGTISLGLDGDDESVPSAGGIQTSGSTPFHSQTFRDQTVRDR